MSGTVLCRPPALDYLSKGRRAYISYSERRRFIKIPRNVGLGGK